MAGEGGQRGHARGNCVKRDGVESCGFEDETRRFISPENRGRAGIKLNPQNTLPMGEEVEDLVFLYVCVCRVGNLAGEPCHV